MKTKLYILLVMIFFITGCSCNYNPKIDGDDYLEETVLYADDSTEATYFNRKWEIAVDKDEYNIGIDEESDMTPVGTSYEYSLEGNTLTFNNTFSKSEYGNSTAASICYNRLAITNYSQSTVISTNSQVNCFDKYPTLIKVTINITVDRPVISNNADSINGSTYTWELNKESKNKAINLVLDDSASQENKSDNNTDNSNNSKRNNKKDYTMYIFSGILLVVLLIGYGIYKKVINKEDSMSD